MSRYQTLTFDIEAHVARVVLNRPEVLNIHNMAMRDDLFEVLSAIREDDEIRVAVFMGAGEKAFCAGADLTEFLTAPPPTAARDVRFDADLWDLFIHMPQPLIAAVHGYCLGSGIEIALCCDLVIAADDARFGLPEMGLGIIPAAGGTQTVPRAVGHGLALDMILNNRWIDAEEACRRGMANRVVAKDRLKDTAEGTAQYIAALDPAVARSIKTAVSCGLDVALDQGLEMEKRLFLSL